MQRSRLPSTDELYVGRMTGGQVGFGSLQETPTPGEGCGRRRGAHASGERGLGAVRQCARRMEAGA